MTQRVKDFSRLNVVSIRCLLLIIIIIINNNIIIITIDDDDWCFTATFVHMVG